MSQKVIIASDSTCDLSPELLERYGVKILPLVVNLGEEQYFDGVDIDPDRIFAYYEKTGELPKTSAPSIAAMEDFFSELTSDGGSVVFFTISAQMSSTYSHACLVAEGFSAVKVVNTKNLSTGGGLLVIRAAELAQEGKNAEEIAKICEELTDRVDASFVIDDLEFLHKGGRCSAVAALGANLLQLKPCIGVHDGKMSMEKKYRGKFSSVLEKYVAERIGDGSGIELDRVFVTHAGCDEEIYLNCMNEVKKLAPFREVLLTRAGCTISSHCGRNTLGVLFIYND